MERWQGRVALVTGASAGIGAAISEALVTVGMKVIGCARSLDKLQAMVDKLTKEKGSFHPVKCDLRKEEEILAMFKHIKEEHGGVDVCINNAGVGHNAPLLTGSTEHWRSMFEVNVLAVNICTREAYASMKERNVTDGHIIHINSISGHVFSPTPGLAFYGGTKHFLRALLMGLRTEIRNTGNDIRVSEISPGPTRTNIAEAFGGKEFAEMYMAREPHLDAVDVSNAVLYALGSPQGVEINDVIIYPTRHGTPKTK